MNALDVASGVVPLAVLAATAWLTVWLYVPGLPTVAPRARHATQWAVLVLHESAHAAIAALTGCRITAFKVNPSGDSYVLYNYRYAAPEDGAATKFVVSAAPHIWWLAAMAAAWAVGAGVVPLWASVLLVPLIPVMIVAGMPSKYDMSQYGAVGLAFMGLVLYLPLLFGTLRFLAVFLLPQSAIHAIGSALHAFLIDLTT